MPFRLRWILAASVLSLGSLVNAQDRKWYFNVLAGQSVILLGSKDNRTVGGAGATYNFGNLGRLRWGKQPGKLLGEVYYHVSEGPAWGTHPVNSAQAWGVLALARYHWTEPGAPRMFADIGWGIQVGSRATRDLSSKLNSTPVFDLGVVVGSDHERSLIGVRYLHISNGGSVHRNKGQNQIFLFVQLPI